MFRLHIDIPLSEDEAPSAEVAKQVVEALVLSLKNKKELGATMKEIPSHYVEKNLCELLKVVQYRLGNDNDRRIRNYLEKDDNGHALEKKLKIEF